jgi:hypothetical protein
LLYVLVISIILFAPLTFANVEPGWLALLLRFVTRLMLMPIVAGIAYEIIRFSAAHDQNRFMRMLITPGLWLQKMTTREPDDTWSRAPSLRCSPCWRQMGSCPRRNRPSARLPPSPHQQIDA